MTSEIPQEELSKIVRIRSGELQTLFEGVTELSGGLEKWLNPPSVPTTACKCVYE
jgi:hypothetical protein